MASAESLYQKRIADRSTYLHEAYRNAQVTLPHLMPDEQDVLTRNGSTPIRVKKGDQSLGARGVNNLAAKLLLTLFPSGSTFFKYMLSEAAVDQAAAEGREEETSELESLLAKREGKINAEIDLQGLRPKLYQAIRHLLVCGQALLVKDPDGGASLVKLNALTIKRNGAGEWVDLIYVEPVTRATISHRPEALDALPPIGPQDDPDTEDKVWGLYTRVIRIRRPGRAKDRFESFQELNGVEIPGTRQMWTEQNLPFIVLGYNQLDGEDYSRAFVEEYRGDLTGFESISRDVKFASGNAAKTIWRISPTSILKPRKFLDTPNGGAVSAGDGELEALQLNKGGDMQVATLQLDRLERALSASFLLNSSFQRNAERVTAEEIRRLAEELEDTLGGVFSLLSQILQLPLARLLEADLVRRNELGKLREDTVRIGVVTGLAAIGRNQELERLRNFLGLVAEAATLLPGLPDWLTEDELMTRLATGAGVDREGLVPTEEEVAEKRQARQQAQSAQTMGGELAKGAGSAVGTAGGQMDPEALVEAVGGVVPGPQ